VQPDPVEPAVLEDPGRPPLPGCTEPNFPADDLMPGTVFKTVKVSGVIPKDLPTGADSLTYMAAAAAARISAPQWSREDMFVV